MVKPLLSVMMPAIRPKNWLGLYNSIVQSLGSLDFEIIFVTPHAHLPPELEGAKNIKLVKDYGSPTRCFGIAMLLAEGEYITWSADDATYVPGQLAKVIETHKSLNNDNLVIAMEQTEATRHYSADSCRINADPGIACNVPDSFHFFPTALMKRQLYEKFGGLNCDYQTHAMAHLDFAIRAQKGGVDVLFYKEIVLHLTHMMGRTGDHGPICDVQTFEDQPLFLARHRDPNYKQDLKIDPFAWQNEAIVWTKRFKLS